MSALVERYRDRTRSRQLASDARAGSWSGGEARKLQYDFVRLHWQRLAVVAAAAVAVCPVALLLPTWTRGVAVGAWLASICWTMALWTILASGAASRMMGDAGEKWSAQDLRSLTSRGWRLANHVMVGPGDLDHVAIGPGGLLVIETKWTSRSCDPALEPQGFAVAARSLADRAGKLRRTLKTTLGDTPLHCAVVVWGPDVESQGDPRFGTVAEVAVLPGSALRAWLDAIPDASVSEGSIAAAWKRLVSDVSWRDAYDERRSAHPRAATAVLLDLALGVGGGFVGACSLGLLAQAWHNIVWVAALPAVLVGLGLTFRRVPALRTLATGWTVGVTTSAVLALSYALYLVVA